MLFSRVFAFATLAMAAPAPSMVARDVVGGGPISTSIEKVATTINNEITQNIVIFNATAANLTNASDSTIQAVIAGLKAIEAAGTAASSALTASIANATSGLNNTIINLTQTEVNNIGQATTDLVTALSQLRPILTVNTNQVTGNLSSALAAEIAAVDAVLSPIVTPLTALGAALATISAKVNTKPFVDAFTALATFFKTLLGQV